MTRLWIVAIVTVVLTGAARASCAQEPSTSGLTRYHDVMAQHAGVWQAEATVWSWENPTEPLMQATATVDAEMIMGGRFLLQDIRGDAAGRPLHGMVVLGYSTAASEYQAMSFNNTSTGLTRSIGVLTETGDIEVHNEFTDPASGETVSRRTVRRLISEDEWLETVHETRGGVERLVMEVRARRTR